MLVPPGATCSVHATMSAAATCERCGGFACDDCLADGERSGALCVACEALVVETHSAKLHSVARKLRAALITLSASAPTFALFEFGREGEEVLSTDWLGFVVAISLFASIVLWCVWQSRASRLIAARKLQLGFGPHAWVYFFVPFANLWKPYQAVRELYWTATGRPSTPDVLVVWWALWIGCNLVSQGIERSAAGASAAPGLDLFAYSLTSAAGIAAYRVVGIITRAITRPRSSKSAALLAWRQATPA